jgi:hypothetical protein
MTFEVHGEGMIGPLRPSHHATPGEAFAKAVALMTRGLATVHMVDLAGRRLTPAEFVKEWPDPRDAVAATSTDAGRRCRNKAEECLQLAELAKLHETRESYQRLAHSYFVLAEQCEATGSGKNAARGSGA